MPTPHPPETSTAASMLLHEWSRLQADHEQYERAALWIKLFAIGLYAWGVSAALGPCWLALWTVLLWLQEAVFKTYQSRLGSRLLRIEADLRQAAGSVPAVAGQLHTQWMEMRPRGTALIAEYARSACRPTVALPYAVLLAAGLAQALRS